MENALEVTGLRKQYGSVVALDDVSLAVSEGSIVGLLGPNGAGKTTLMKVIVGLIKADAGTVRTAGSNAGAPVSIGALIERPGFYPYLSARRNLEALGLTAALAPSKLKNEIVELLDRVELSRAADRRFGTFSTGMKQRLGLAAALLGSPRLLVLDEPVNGLDPAGVAAIRRLLLDLRAEGRTILVSSHLLGEVEQVCDQIAIINQGRLLRSGTIAEIAAGPATWLLKFQDAEHATRAELLLRDSYITTVTGAEIRAAPRNGAESLPLELLSPTGLVPREAVHQQKTLEQAYLDLVGAHDSGQTR